MPAAGSYITQSVMDPTGPLKTENVEALTSGPTSDAAQLHGHFIPLRTEAALTIGEVVCLDTSGFACRADASDPDLFNAMAVVVTGNVLPIAVASCMVAGCLEFGAWQSGDRGMPLYLSETVPGAMTLTRPSAPGSYIVLLGSVSDTDQVVLIPPRVLIRL